MNRVTVHKAIKRYEELGTLEDRPGRGDKRTVRTLSMVNRIRKRIRRNPTVPQRELARRLNISARSVNRVVCDQLGLRAYRQTRCQRLELMHLTKRLRCARALQQRFREGRHLQVVWSDEKIFGANPIVNPQNDRVLAHTLEEANQAGRRVGQRQFAPQVHVWGAITSNGKCPLVFFEPGEKVNAELYLTKVLEGALLPWTRRHFNRCHWIFQQDGATAHTSRRVQEWCKNRLPEFIAKDEWPPRSPDLNPLDFSVWSVMERKVHATTHVNRDSLKKTILKAWDELSPEYLRPTVDSVPRRLRAVISARGGLFE
jgi:hypothetical protein